MTAFGFRWYGPEDAVTLEHIRQIPPVTELVTSLYHIPAGALWPEEDIAARAAPGCGGRPALLGGGGIAGS